MIASDYVRFIRYYGQLDTGLVIGLEIDVNTWVDVQVYNSAGLGPRSEAYIMETSGFGEYWQNDTPSFRLRGM